MSYPRVSNKHTYESITTAKELIKKLKPELLNSLKKDGLFPEKMLLIYDKHLLKYIVKTYGGKPIELFNGEAFNLKKLKKTAVTGNFGIGGPAVVTLIELYIALGIKIFYTIGYAGGISSEIEIGDVVICDTAIPDDGVTQHYFGDISDISAYQEVIESITNIAERENIEFKIGKVWSTAALFRETGEEIEYMQKQNVLAVDMEAASLLAIGKYYNVKIGIILVISDKLSDMKWQFNVDGSRKIIDKLRKSVKLSIE